MATILLYNVQNDTALRATLRATLRGTDAKTIYVPPADFGRPIGALLGLPGASAPIPVGDGALFSDPMLVFCGFTDEALDALLQKLRQAGAVVPLKAVLTEHNVFWSSSRLHKELSAEHRAFTEDKRSKN